MSPFKVVVLMMFTLPAWLFKEGLDRLHKYTHEDKWWWQLPYIFLLILIVLTVVLWIVGVI